MIRNCSLTLILLLFQFSLVFASDRHAQAKITLIVIDEQGITIVRSLVLFHRIRRRAGIRQAVGEDKF